MEASPSPLRTDNDAPDPRRWFAAAIVSLSALIVVLDNTVLNVAIPTILREFHTDLPSLQWVLTGYSLTFATLLIIGGRLGDMFGHRQTFLIGAGIFGVGSLLAALSTSVPTLFVGEAIIEGIGASLMLPATLSILSTMFRGRERADRVRGSGAQWPVPGSPSVRSSAVSSRPRTRGAGRSASTSSWRRSLLSARSLFIPHDERAARRPRIDLPGRAPDRGGIVHGGVRDQRGVVVRVVVTHPGLRPRPAALARDAVGVDHAVRVRPRLGVPRGFLRGRTGNRAP